MTGFELAKLVSRIPPDALPRAERAVLQAMAYRYPNIWPAVATLGAEAGYSPAITSKSLTGLLERKLIEIADGSNRKGGKKVTTRYVINEQAITTLALVKDANLLETRDQGSIPSHEDCKPFQKQRGAKCPLGFGSCQWLNQEGTQFVANSPRNHFSG
jgi:hypothetical protein